MVNKKYKDRLFCLLFGSEAYKENMLSLYNALCDTNYTDINDIKIYTIDDVIYVKMKNDVSILIDSYLCLWEQQSTFNPNMPIRGLMYYGKMYSRYITENKLNLYGKTLVLLPTPRYTVFYNGGGDYPDTMDLKLSDAFAQKDVTHGFEWTAHMINLNFGKNDELLDKCKPLKGYMILIHKIRLYQQGKSLEDAVNAAVDDCISNNILADLLVKHRSEVIEMCITEYDEKTIMDGIREEGMKQGIITGEILGKKNMIYTMHKNGMAIDDIAKFTGIASDTIKQWLMSMQKNVH